MDINSRAYIFRLMMLAECRISTQKRLESQEKGHPPSSENVNQFPENETWFPKNEIVIQFPKNVTRFLRNYYKITNKKVSGIILGDPVFQKCDQISNKCDPVSHKYDLVSLKCYLVSQIYDPVS